MVFGDVVFVVDDLDVLTHEAVYGRSLGDMSLVLRRVLLNDAERLYVWLNDHMLNIIERLYSSLSKTLR